MTLAQLRSELQARGFDYVTDARLNSFLNRVYQEVCEEEAWPFLESETSSAAPVSVSDLRTVEAVVNTTQKYKLTPLDRRNITDFNSDLTTTGTPAYYYITSGNTVNVFPANTTDTISVRYWKVPTDLTDDSDEPVIPSRFHLLLVDGAAVYTYFDTDNFEAASSADQLFQASKARMRDALLVQQNDQPDDIVVSLVDHQDGTYW